MQQKVITQISNVCSKVFRSTITMEQWEVQLWLLFGCRLVQTVMRLAMGPLLVYICKDFECSATDKGGLLSAFSLGWCLTD